MSVTWRARVLSAPLHLVGNHEAKVVCVELHFAAGGAEGGGGTIVQALGETQR